MAFLYYPWYYRNAMATRTVRLDAEAEATLTKIRKVTGLPISEALKQGLKALHKQVEDSPQPTAFEVYQKLDLGPGGYAKYPSTETRRGVREILLKKHKR
jgi:hypothetical protein